MLDNSFKFRSFQGLCWIATFWYQNLQFVVKLKPGPCCLNWTERYSSCNVLYIFMRRHLYRSTQSGFKPRLELRCVVADTVPGGLCVLAKFSHYGRFHVCMLLTCASMCRLRRTCKTRLSCVGWGRVWWWGGVITSSRPRPWYYVDNMFSWSSSYVDSMLPLSSYYVDNMLSWSSYYADNMLKYLDTNWYYVLGSPEKWLPKQSQAVEYEETVQWTCSGQSSPRGEGMAMAMTSQQKCEYIIPHWLQNRCAKTLDGCASGVPEVRKWRYGPQAVGHGVTYVVLYPSLLA